MSTEDEKKLQRELEEEKFKGVYAKIEANNKFTNKVIESNHSLVMAELKKILEQGMANNDRITKSENVVDCLGEEVKFLSKDINSLKSDLQLFIFIKKYPKLAIVALVGFLVLVNLGNINSIITNFIK